MPPPCSDSITAWLMTSEAYPFLDLQTVLTDLKKLQLCGLLPLAMPSNSRCRHFCFSHKSRTEPNVIGLYNTSPGRNTNALNLIRIYADFEVSTGSANIRIPSMFRLIPTQEGATSGIVEVIDQRITIVRRSSSGLPPFTVGLSGSGTYNELTGILLANIIFDESELGFPAPILRRYSYEAQER